MTLLKIVLAVAAFLFGLWLVMEVKKAPLLEDFEDLDNKKEDKDDSKEKGREQN